jgi:predicted O-methyltransferase YrrM
MLKLAFRYLHYKLFAPHRKGFGVHSPFVFHLVTKVFTKRDDENLGHIKSWRRSLIRNRTVLETSDTGAGSRIHKGRGRSIQQIALKSSIRHKYGRILYAVAKEFKPATIIELGTGIGISTAYLAKGCPDSKLISFEGDIQKMNFASKSLETLGLQNVTLQHGIFKDLFPDIMAQAKIPVLIFLDGDHTYEGTMLYFEQILKSRNPEILVLLDDIRWSPDMERAWNEIKLNPEVVTSVDLFFMGIVFFREGMMKEDFVVNF